MKPKSDQSRYIRCTIFPIIFTHPNPNPNLTPNTYSTGQHLLDKVHVTRGLDNNVLRDTVQKLLTLLRNKTLQYTSRLLTKPRYPMDNMFQ